MATTVQSLGSLLKSARDIMRKDNGLNGDLDRLPLLTWIMFLKFLDGLEIQREKETALTGLGRFVWELFSWGCARRCTPGYHMTGLSALRNLRSAFTWPGLQPAKTPSCRIVGISLLGRAGNWIVRGRGTWSGQLCLGLKARNVIAWDGASLRAEAQVTSPHKYPQPCKGETPSAPCLNPSPTS